MVIDDEIVDVNNVVHTLGPCQIEVIIVINKWWYRITDDENNADPMPL